MSARKGRDGVVEQGAQQLVDRSRTGAGDGEPGGAGIVEDSQGRQFGLKISFGGRESLRRGHIAGKSEYLTIGFRSAMRHVTGDIGTESGPSQSEKIRA